MPESDSPSYSFPRAKRLTRGPEIEHVRKEGKRVRTSSLEVRTLASLHSFPRVGVIVPKYGHNSVERNRVKRQLRELVRLEMLPLLPATDVVLRAAPRAYNRTFQQLREEAQKVVRMIAASPHTVRAEIPEPPPAPAP